MALTKLQALDKFCTYFDYTNTKIGAETKIEFLARKEKEWAITIVALQLRAEAQLQAKTDSDTAIIGLDL